jgi:Fe-S-cluster containining protein
VRHLPVLAERSVSEAHAESIRIADQFYQRAFSENPRITCTKGCDHCCYYPVTLTILEGISLYRWLLKNRLWTTALRKKCEEHSRQTHGLAPEIWLLSELACPLLEDHLCSAYEARPFMCRTTISTGDPYECHPHRLSKGNGGIVKKTPEMIEFMEKESKLLRQHQLRYMPVSLSTALLMAEGIDKHVYELEDFSSEVLKLGV